MMKRRSFLYYSLLFIAGCSTAAKNPPSASLPPLRFAVTDIREREELETLYGDFRGALEEVLETPIEFVLISSYTAPAVALKSGEVDLAFTGPSEYVVIRSRTNAVPMIALTRPGYYSLIAVPKDSPIKTVADLKGKTMAMKSLGSTSGHLGPTKILISAGLEPKTDLEIKMLGEEGAIAALKNGEVDAWGGSAIIYKKELQDDANSFPILIEGPPLPNDVFVAGSTLTSEMVAEIRDRIDANKEKLVQIIARSEKRFAKSEFVSVKDEDYDPIRDAYKALGKDEYFF